jgi:hypothetical protein
MTITDAAQTGVVPASGTLRLRFTPNARQSWVVSQVSVNALAGAIDPGGSAQCNIFLDTSFVAVLAMPQDVGSGDPPVIVNNGRTLSVLITGATAGAVVQATILYDDGQGLNG